LICKVSNTRQITTDIEYLNGLIELIDIVSDNELSAFFEITSKLNSNIRRSRQMLVTWYNSNFSEF